MKRLALILLAVMSLQAAPTIATIAVTEVSYSAARVDFTFNTTLGLPTNVRLRQSTSDCTGGTGGKVVAPGFLSMMYAMTLQAGGLTPATLTYFCVELYDGVTWTHGGQTTATTSALPGTVPVPPTLPDGFDTTLSLSGAVDYNVASDCSDLQSQINAANAARTIAGTTRLVKIPASTTCTGTATYTLPAVPWTKTLTSIDGSTCTWTIASHGYSNGQTVKANGAANIPGRMPLPDGATYYFAGTFLNGVTYYVVNATTNTFQLAATLGGSPIPCGNQTFTADASADTITVNPSQIAPFGVVWGGSYNYPMRLISTGTLPGGLATATDYWPVTACTGTGGDTSATGTVCTTGLSLTNGGAAVNITSAGTGTHTLVTSNTSLSTTQVAAWSETAPEVVITTDQLSSLPAAGNRISLEQEALMPKILQTSGNGVYKFLVDPSGTHYRLKGLNITRTPVAEPLTVVSPSMTGGVMYAEPSASHIILDQIYDDALGYPNRSGNSQFIAQGQEMAVIDSTILHDDVWRAYQIGWLPSKTSGTTMKVTAGTLGLGAKLYTKTSSTDSTLTITAGTGTGYVYTDINGVLTALLTTGTTASWSCGTGISCAVTLTASPTWPTSGGIQTVYRLATVAYASGTISTVTEDLGLSIGINEGITTINAGGSWKTVVRNSTIESVGIPFHVDSCAGYTINSDFTVDKNWFKFPQYAILGQSGSNGLWYGNRQGPEGKCGKVWSLTGNIVSDFFTQVTAASVTFALTPIDKSEISDVTIKSNMLMYGAGGVSVPGRSASRQFGPLNKRAAYTNNLIVTRGDIRGAAAEFTGTKSAAQGWLTEGGNVFESLKIANNLNYKSRGSIVSNYANLGGGYSGGLSFTSNILPYSSPAAFYYSGNVECGGGGSTIDMDFVGCTNPASGAAGYVMNSTNVFVGSYTDAFAGTGTGISIATMTGAGHLPGATAVGDQGSVDANWTSVGFANEAALNFRIPSGAYSSTGPNYTTLYDDAWIIRDIVVTPGSTSAATTYTAPSTSQIQIGLSTDGGTTWSYQLDGQTNAGARSFSITGLTAGTAYKAKFLGHFEQVSGMYLPPDAISVQDFTTTSATTGTAPFKGKAALAGKNAVN